VCVKNVGASAFSLVAALFWLYMWQPERNMLVSGVWALQAGIQPSQGGARREERGAREWPEALGNVLESVQKRPGKR
jgi:hypothetical protein